jgi:stage V sporulation protein AC
MGTNKNPLETKEGYQNYVDQKSPNSPIWKNCFNAFWVGGLICTIGQIISNICKQRGFDIATSGTIVSIILIGIAAFLTGLNIFNKIGKFAGAGSLVPITGFANSIVSPAMEYKSEGYVMGVGGKMFTVAGPVLVFGISASILIGIIYMIFNTQSITLV